MKVINTLFYLFFLYSLLSCNRNEFRDVSSNMDLKVLNQIFEIIQDERTVEEIQEFKKLAEEEVIPEHHRLGWGIWIRNNYLNKKSSNYHSDLVLFFKSNGIFLKDDMNSIILISFHRKINNKPLLVEEQVEEYKKFMLDHAFEVEEQKK